MVNLSEFIPLTDYEAREMKPLVVHFPSSTFVYKCRPQIAMNYVSLWMAKNSITQMIENSAVEASESDKPAIARMKMITGIMMMVKVLWSISDKRKNILLRTIDRLRFQKLMLENIDIAYELWEKTLAHSGRLLRHNEVPSELRSNTGSGLRSDWSRNFFAGHDPYRETWLEILNAHEYEKEKMISQNEIHKNNNAKDGKKWQLKTK